MDKFSAGLLSGLLLALSAVTVVHYLSSSPASELRAYMDQRVDECLAQRCEELHFTKSGHQWRMRDAHGLVTAGVDILRPGESMSIEVPVSAHREEPKA
jgi:hypothetical protein